MDINWLFFLLWYLTGALSLLIGSKWSAGEVTRFDVVLIVCFGLAGPLVLVVFAIAVLCGEEWLEKKLF